MRLSNVPIGNNTSYGLLLSLGAAPLTRFEYSHQETLPEFKILRYARTEADIDSLIDEVRATYSRLLERTRSTDASPSNDPSDIAERAAEHRLRQQLDSGLLEWRLEDLRERTIALLRAEIEHHQHVFAARRGEVMTD